MSGAGNAEISNNCEEQGQGKSSDAQVRSTAARFQIRSAKERQKVPSKEPTMGMKTIHSRFEGGTTENVRRRSNDCGKEGLRARPNSPPSPDSNVTDKQRPASLNLDGVTNVSEWPVGSETPNATQAKPDCVGSLTIRARGRTEWRRPNLTNRSKSLDWRGIERGKENQTMALMDAADVKVLRRSESLHENGPGNSPKPNEPSSPSKSVSLRIQAYNSIGQGKQNSNTTVSPVISGFSSVRMGRVALAVERASSGQSLPSRLKSQDSTEERKNPWWLYGQGSPKSGQMEMQLCSQVSESKISEITGNQSIMDRIGKLYGWNGPEDNLDPNSRDSIQSKRNSAPVGDWLYSSDVFDSHSSHRSPKKDGADLTSTTDTPSTVSPNITVRKDTGISCVPASPMSPWSKERPLGKDSKGLVAGNSGWNMRSQLGESVEKLGTHSLDRARSRKSPAALSRALRTQESSCSASDSCTPGKARQLTKQQSLMTDVERDKQVDTMTDHSTHDKAMETGPKNQVHDSPKSLQISGTGQSKPQFARSVTLDSERYKANEDVFDLGSLTVPRMKRVSLQEIGQVASLDSVQKTIRKFETLANQNQNPLQTIRTRRTFSVPEKPNLVVGVCKSNSDKSLSEWKGVWNTSNLRENAFSKSDSFDLSGPAKSPTTDKGRSTIKTQTREVYRQVPEFAQKQLDRFESDQSIEVKDEPDCSNASPTNQKNMESTEETVRSPFIIAISQNSNNQTTNLSHPDIKDLSRCLSDPKDEANLQLQEHSTGNSMTKSSRESQTPESTSVFPDLLSSSSIKLSLDNSTQPKSPAIPFCDSTVTTPAFPAVSDLNNVCGTRPEEVAAKVSRWIANKKDGVNATANDSDDDDDEDDDDEGTERGDDSDSGESSVTITSQSDHMSFSLSLADLCTLGGLDYPPSGGNGSMDEEKWMSKRSASLSSDISVLSSVTLLATEELDCLLEDVKGLGDETLQNSEDVQVVVLHKEMGRGLGFTVAGGVDQNKPVTVHRVFPYGAAGQEGSIQEGDQVLSINGTALHKSAHWEALRTLRKARTRGMAVVVIRPAGSRMRVILTKSSYDLGFSLEGGVGSSLGDKPLTVQRIFQGGPVGKVFPGDELLEVQGQSLIGLRRLEAWNLIKRLPAGPVEVLLHRPHQLY